MNILFLTLLDFSSYSEHNIYCDLLREFIKEGHNVYCISPKERKTKEKTHFEENGCLLKLRIGNIQKTNIIEKGISTLMVEPEFINAIKKYFSNVKFDLVLYSTPPITFVKAIKYVKERDGAATYLLLKDIFPQNAIDIGLMSETGVKGMLYKYFRKKEKKLYALSDRIGCMSPANVEYVLKHNPEINSAKVEVCPNCISPVDMSLTSEKRKVMREKYGIPYDKKVFVYGGNLGKPQGIDFLIECLRSQKDNQDLFFLIVGDGTEYEKLNAFVNTEYPQNVKLMRSLSKDDYDRMVAACDVGMIFLDYRFTIPNFPSRILSYMQAKIPILAVTDPNTDIGKIIVEAGFGWWCESCSLDKFDEVIKKILPECFDVDKKNKEWAYLVENYSANSGFKVIEKGLQNERI